MDPREQWALLGEGTSLSTAAAPAGPLRGAIANALFKSFWSQSPLRYGPEAFRGLWSQLALVQDGAFFGEHEASGGRRAGFSGGDASSDSEAEFHDADGPGGGQLVATTPSALELQEVLAAPGSTRPAAFVRWAVTYLLDGQARARPSAVPARPWSSFWGHLRFRSLARSDGSFPLRAFCAGALLGDALTSSSSSPSPPKGRKIAQAVHRALAIQLGRGRKGKKGAVGGLVKGAEKIRVFQRLLESPDQRVLLGLLAPEDAQDASTPLARAYATLWREAPEACRAAGLAEGLVPMLEDAFVTVRRPGQRQQPGANPPLRKKRLAVRKEVPLFQFLVQLALAKEAPKAGVASLLVRTWAWVQKFPAWWASFADARDGRAPERRLRALFYGEEGLAGRLYAMQKHLLPVYNAMERLPMDPPPGFRPYRHPVSMALLQTLRGRYIGEEGWVHEGKLPPALAALTPEGGSVLDTVGSGPGWRAALFLLGGRPGYGLEPSRPFASSSSSSAGGDGSEQDVVVQLEGGLPLSQAAMVGRQRTEMLRPAVERAVSNELRRQRKLRKRAAAERSVRGRAGDGEDDGDEEEEDGVFQILGGKRVRDDRGRGIRRDEARKARTWAALRLLLGTMSDELLAYYLTLNWTAQANRGEQLVQHAWGVAADDTLEVLEAAADTERAQQLLQSPDKASKVLRLGWTEEMAERVPEQLCRLIAQSKGGGGDLAAAPGGLEAMVREVTPHFFREAAAFGLGTGALDRVQVSLRPARDGLTGPAHAAPRPGHWEETAILIQGLLPYRALGARGRATARGTTLPAEAQAIARRALERNMSPLKLDALPMVRLLDQVLLVQGVLTAPLLRATGGGEGASISLEDLAAASTAQTPRLMAPQARSAASVRGPYGRPVGGRLVFERHVDPATKRTWVLLHQQPSEVIPPGHELEAAAAFAEAARDSDADAALDFAGGSDEATMSDWEREVTSVLDVLGAQNELRLMWAHLCESDRRSDLRGGGDAHQQRRWVRQVDMAAVQSFPPWEADSPVGILLAHFAQVRGDLALRALDLGQRLWRSAWKTLVPMACPTVPSDPLQTLQKKIGAFFEQHYGQQQQQPTNAGAGEQSKKNDEAAPRAPSVRDTAPSARGRFGFASARTSLLRRMGMGQRGLKRRAGSVPDAELEDERASKRRRVGAANGGWKRALPKASETLISVRPADDDDDEEEEEEDAVMEEEEEEEVRAPRRRSRVVTIERKMAMTPLGEHLRHMLLEESAAIGQRRSDMAHRRVHPPALTEVLQAFWFGGRTKGQVLYRDRIDGENVSLVSLSLSGASGRGKAVIVDDEVIQRALESCMNKLRNEGVSACFGAIPGVKNGEEDEGGGGAGAEAVMTTTGDHPSRPGLVSDRWGDILPMVREKLEAPKRKRPAPKGELTGKRKRKRKIV